MGSILMMIWKMIEILPKFPKEGSRFKNGLEISMGWGYPLLYLFAYENNLRLEKRRKTVGSSFRGKVGFHNIKNRMNKVFPSGLTLFLLSYRVPMNL
jgi:hypothetical protein